MKELLTTIYIIFLSIVLAGCGRNLEPLPPVNNPANTPGASLKTHKIGFMTPTPNPSSVPGEIFVDPDTKLGDISPLVYGTNVGPWQYITRSMRPYVLKAGFHLLRFPGGNWGDEYILTHEHLDEFISLCNTIGAEPLVQVKLFQGSPEEAAELVRYANVERGYGIKYWNIGNEPDLYAVTRGEPDYTPERFNKDWKLFAKAMHSVDPAIQLVGPEISSYPDPSGSTWNRREYLWMEEFLRTNGSKVDVVSFHWYPFGKPGATKESLLEQPPEWDGVIGKLRHEIRQIVGKDTPIAITEVNSDWTNAEGGTATPDSYYNALWWADVLGRLIRQRVFMVGEFSLSGAGGLGLLSPESPRPTYYVYLLYRHFGDTAVYASSPNPMVPVYASTDRKSLYLLAVNKTAAWRNLPLKVQNMRLPDKGRFWQLTTSGLSEGRSNGKVLSLPPYSATMFQWVVGSAEGR